jgi:hypothetical protein
MGTAVLNMPKELGVVNVSGGVFAMPSFHDQRHSSRRLSQSASELITNITSVLGELVCGAIQKRSAEEFAAYRDEVFVKYFDAVRSLSDLLRIVTPPQVQQLLVVESLASIESEINSKGMTAFGSAVRDQAIFTIWTMRKMSVLCQTIDNTALPYSLIEEDREIRTKFAFHAVASRFHLDCLLKSMALNIPIYPDVLELVIDGLRNAVNAYTWAARALELRAPKADVQTGAVEWDDEDRQLLEEAGSDFIEESA